MPPPGGAGTGPAAPPVAAASQARTGSARPRGRGVEPRPPPARARQAHCRPEPPCRPPRLARRPRRGGRPLLRDRVRPSGPARGRGPRAPAAPPARSAGTTARIPLPILPIVQRMVPRSSCPCPGCSNAEGCRSEPRLLDHLTKLPQQSLGASRHDNAAVQRAIVGLQAAQQQIAQHNHVRPWREVALRPDALQVDPLFLEVFEDLLLAPLTAADRLQLLTVALQVEVPLQQNLLCLIQKSHHMIPKFNVHSVLLSQLRSFASCERFLRL